MATHTPLPSIYYSLVEREPHSVLLESSRIDDENKHSYLFLHPVKIISIHRPEEVERLFAEIEQCIGEGYFVAGYLGYECGYHFEQIAREIPLDPEKPLAWFGVYSAPFIFDHELGNFNSAPPVPPKLVPSGFVTKDFEMVIPQDDYKKAISRIKDYIVEGDTYQVNFTNKYRFRFDGSPGACYKSLREVQRVGYGAFINTGQEYILSFSPELFFRTEAGRLITRPMKGTARRGKTNEEDSAIVEWLRGDEKNRSENLMIVDLLRNDLGRIAELGSVSVKEMFAVEKYETLFQMTSTIECNLAGSPPFYDIFRSLFPSGSVTGAPKIRTMQIIHELEPRPRGVYTGSIGYISPGRDASFNIAIRTIVIDGEKGEMGIGSGIVFDSDAQEEYEECRLKASFLTEPPERFQLIESMLWDREYRRLAAHMNRLRSSAMYFGFRFNEREILEALNQNGALLLPDASYKVRLLLDAYGALSIDNQPITNVSSTGRVTLSSSKTSSSDRFLYHKTTRRKLYETEFAKAVQAGFDDIVFLNERDEVTEGAISNIFIEKSGVFYTPPLSSGLLAGIYREELLRTMPGTIQKVLEMEDLLSAGSIFVCNAIRGMRKVELVRE